MSIERSFKGIWIPSEIWLDKSLTVMEKLFFVEINSLDNDNGCFASNGYFSEFFGVNKPRCTQIIKELERKELVTIELERKGKQIIKRVIRVVNILNRGYLENDHRVVNKCIDPYLENDHDSNTKENNTINKKEAFSKLDNSLTEIFSEYLKVRKTIRIQDNDYSINLMIKNLNKHSLENQTVMLENAITGRYKVLYPIKTQNNNVSKFPKKYDIDDGIEKVAERNIPDNHQPWLNEDEAGEQQ